MSKMIQIRNVPDEIHRKLKARAATEGKSLSDYLLQEVIKVMDRPSISELRKRISERIPIKPTVSPVQAIRLERDRR